MTESKKARVAVVFTGGTISMRFDPAADGPVPMLSGDEILAQVPGLGGIAETTTLEFARVAGPHMTPRQMFDLSRLVAKQLECEDIDGVVITHGTDTLEETAYLLDLVLRSEKPVVLVGAMRNSSELSWDGPANLHSAIRVASDSAARGLGVTVVMSEQILAAPDATKVYSESLATYQARDLGPLGLVDKDRVIVRRRRVVREHIAATRLEENIEIVKLSAGSDGRFIRFAVENGMGGLIIEGMGRGHVPITALNAVEQGIRSGIPIVITSRCPRGRVLDTYGFEGGGKHLRRMGAILGGTIPSHKARIKLMLLLGAGTALDKIRESFESGE
jgi:L-asparaginase